MVSGGTRTPALGWAGENRQYRVPSVIEGVERDGRPQGIRAAIQPGQEQAGAAQFEVLAWVPVGHHKNDCRNQRARDEVSMLTEAAQEKSAVQQLLRYRTGDHEGYHRQAQCPASLQKPSPHPTFGIIS